MIGAAGETAGREGGWLRLRYGAPEHVPDAVFKRFLRFPRGREFEGPLADAAAWARAWFAANARPWVGARRVEAAAIEDGVMIDGELFGNGSLSRRYAAITTAAIIAASAGPEAEAEAARRFAEGEPDRHYFLACYAAAVVETLLAEVARSLGVRAGYYGPGYADWPIGESSRLVDCLRRGAPLPGPLVALDSGMLSPKHSRLAVVPATHHEGPTP